MPDIQDIHSAAESWIERYGNESLEQLKQRLTELEECGEREAFLLWTKIYDEAQSLIKPDQPTG